MIRLLTFLLLSNLATAQLKVAALHPVLGDLARQIGGDRVEVTDMLKPGGDMHHFEPAGQDLAKLKGASLILASGKHLESYLDKLRDTVGSVPILEVGSAIPSIKIEANSEIFMNDHGHDHGTSGVDPHWWHSADNMKRAARILRDAFSNADPTNAASYKAGAAVASEKFDELKAWAQQQISTIPKSDRKLITGHAAFGYFCKEYGFKSLPILGVDREDDTSPQYLSNAIKIIRENNVRAAFPEDQANPKVLAEIVRETGVKLGAPLIADGTALKAHTFETMFRSNVESIVKALGKK
jgi:zinc/manganese transport system substrate-binding protein